MEYAFTSTRLRGLVCTECGGTELVEYASNTKHTFGMCNVNIGIRLQVNAHEYPIDIRCYCKKCECTFTLYSLCEYCNWFLETIQNYINTHGEANAIYNFGPECMNPENYIYHCCTTPIKTHPSPTGITCITSKVASGILTVHVHRKSTGVVQYTESSKLQIPRYVQPIFKEFNNYYKNIGHTKINNRYVLRIPSPTNPPEFPTVYPKKESKDHHGPKCTKSAAKI